MRNEIWLNLPVKELEKTTQFYAHSGFKTKLAPKKFQTGKSMIINIILVLVALIAVVLIYASTKPKSYYVERSISIQATAEKIYPHINDLKAWEAWTPYNKDPNMQKTYSANTVGKGAHYAWAGNKEMGKGDITISDSTAPSQVLFDLHFVQPFEATNKVIFSLKPAGDMTAVSWRMDGESNLMFNVMGIFINMDNMIGKDFEVGLARLKALAEK